MNLYSPKVIKEIKNKFRFRNSKSLGQNFLTDPEVIGAIVSGAEISRGDLVLEIGPGLGVLTDAAAKKAGKVIAVELDRDLIPILTFTLQGHDNIKIINQDILKTNINKLIEEEREDFSGIKIVGNLPYYITTPILMKLLEENVKADSITIMMQKEVAERIKAEPGGKTYGALSVAVQYRCETEIIAEVPKESFYPAPKVDSEVLKLTVLDEPVVKPKSEELFFRTVKAGFSQRRKTILNSLTAAGYNKDEIKKALKNVGIESIRRAETLSLVDFCNISDYLFSDYKS